MKAAYTHSSPCPNYGCYGSGSAEKTRRHTFENVTGFFSEQFEKSPWTQKVEDVYNCLKGLESGNPLQDFPRCVLKTRVWEWWYTFQRTYLDETPRVGRRVRRKSKAPRVNVLSGHLNSSRRPLPLDPTTISRRHDPLGKPLYGALYHPIYSLPQHRHRLLPR